MIIFPQGVFGWAGEINVFKHALAANGFFANGERVSGSDQSGASICPSQPIRRLYLSFSANQKLVFVGQWGAGGPGWPGRLLQADGGHEGEFWVRVLILIVIFFSSHKVAHNSSLRPWLRQLRQRSLGARLVTYPGILRGSLNYMYL